MSADKVPTNHDAMAQGASLYGSKQVRAADAALIASGTAGYELMCRAARGALRALQARWPVARDLLIICGAGNNGGDGYALARCALARGLSPRVLAVTPIERLRGDAARAAADCRAAGVPMFEAAQIGVGETLEQSLARELEYCDVIIDAMLGIGLAADVREPFVTVIARVNEMTSARHTSSRPVVALDVPSGLCADTGAVRGLAIRADLTVTFILQKVGLCMGEGPRQAGEVVLDDLGAPHDIVEGAAGRPLLRRLDAVSARQALPRRRHAAHKGEAGHVLVIAGGSGMSGAARLAGEAALRAGAGRVTVLAAPAAVISIAAGCAELMVRGIDSDKEIAALVAATDALAIGPGLGLSPWARALFATAIEAARAAGRPTVIDADALNLLAANFSAAGASESALDQPGRIELPDACVLTPHPGEAGRLLGIGADAVQADRLAALEALSARYGSTVVLKGAGSLVTADLPEHPPWLCTVGNPAMAAPGMGDVLTGVIGALLGQGLPPPAAARVGVWWHAMAGDVAAAGADRGLLASELTARLPTIVRGLLA